MVNALRCSLPLALSSIGLYLRIGPAYTRVSFLKAARSRSSFSSSSRRFCAAISSSYWIRARCFSLNSLRSSCRFFEFSSTSCGTVAGLLLKTRALLGPSECNTGRAVKRVRSYSSCCFFASSRSNSLRFCYPRASVCKVNEHIVV